ncbi:unnamed protein product [Closterium sp. NIES-53]
MDNASKEAGPLPYCSVPIPMDDENPRESVNVETYFDFADTGYVTPAEVNTNEAERIGPNFIPDPKTVQQALGGEHREKWREAMDKELEALKERNTWKVVPIGVARKKTILTGKWIFRVKTKADGTIDKFKARWVVRGFDQEHGRDFTETFAPVSRHTSLRTLLAIAAMKEKTMRQIDVANAFLYAPIDAEIYIELPHGSHGEPNQFCQLQKSLYGIKQAPRLWQQYLHARLTRIGFKGVTERSHTYSLIYRLTIPRPQYPGRRKRDLPQRCKVWLDDLQLFLQSDSKDGLSLFDLTSGTYTAPAADADSTVRSQWLTRDAAARLAVRNHLPSTERAHFSQYKSARALYDAVVARYSSPTTAALSRLMLPYLFPDLAAFATVADLVAHLRTSDARYRAALPTDILAVGASCGDRRTPFFEGCSPVPLLPSVASAAAVDLVGTEEVGAASAPSGRRRTGKGKGSRGGGGGSGGSGGGGGGGGGCGGGGSGSGGVCGGSGGRGGGDGGGGGGGGGGSGGGGRRGGGAGRGAATQRGGLGGSQRQQQLRTLETPSVQQLREWYAGRGRSGSAGPCTYVLCTSTRSGEVCGLPHTTQRCFGHLTDAWRTQFPDAVELPRWHDLLLQNVPIFDLDFDAILAAMYALADITEGDCYLRVPSDLGTVAAALGASASAAPGTSAAAALAASASAAPGAGTSPLSYTAPTASFHTFTLDSVLAHSAIVLPCPAAPSGLLSGLHLPSFSTNLVSGADLEDAWVDQFTPGGQRVTHCTCSRTGRHLATFTRRPGSSLYTLTTAPPPISASGQVPASSQVFAAASRSSPASAPCSCRPLAHETLLWHHRLGHPSLPRLRGMASCALVLGLSRSLPPLPLGPAPTYVPCVKGRQRAAPHSSSFPPTEAPLQTLHMDVWGPARVRGQGHERYFLLVVDDYSRYTTVFPLRSKVLCLHSDRGGEFSSDLLRAFCRSEGTRQTFTLPASPQQNGIAECRIGMVMDVAHTSMIHAAAPHFLWPFAVQYAAHQINLQPRVSLPETTPTLRWTGKVGDAYVFRVWGSRAFVRDTTADKLSSRDVPCVFLGFPPDAPAWQFYHPTSRRVLSSQDVTFDESVSYYRLFPYRTASSPPPATLLGTRSSPGTPPPPSGSCPLWCVPGRRSRAGRGSCRLKCC